MLSQRIAQHVCALPEVRSAPLVGLYAEGPRYAEVSTVELHRTLVDLRIRVAYPRVVGDALEFCEVERDDLVPGFREIPEPAPDVAALHAVPVMVVDRLGQGAGYYDRVITDLAPFTIGVAFDVQIVSVLPLEPHDRRLDVVVTENGVHR